MNKKLRKKQKRFEIKWKKMIKESAKYFSISNPWPSRGFRAKHIKDDDAFKRICCNYFNTFYLKEE